MTKKLPNQFYAVLLFKKYLHSDFLRLDVNQIQRSLKYCDRTIQNVDGPSTRLRADGYNSSSDADWPYLAMD